MMTLCSELLRALDGKTLATAESCTGGMLGAALTTVPGASAVYRGGIISYQNFVKQKLLRVGADDLETVGPVSAQVACAMARGAREQLQADLAVSVTGLAGPDGDEFGYPVGTVFIGISDAQEVIAREFHFSGDREAVRRQAAQAALRLLLQRLCPSDEQWEETI